nr:MAG TPA: hypothetical protein [Bacteriophage sp.]DAP53827.1 MAG TPA: hypothetical protein [Caudoviricetes sp.]
MVIAIVSSRENLIQMLQDLHVVIIFKIVYML